MMTTHQDFLGLVHPGRQIGGPAMVWMKLFHEIAVRPRNVLTRGSLLQSQNFIGLVLRNRARMATRARTVAPRVSLTISCLTPAGKSAVEIHL